MVVAKTEQAHRSLAAQFKQHSITRVYEALAWGAVKKLEGVIELPIGRDVKERKKFSPRTARPKGAATAYRVAERLGKLATLLEVFPRTGRTHQIRVHLAALGHPVLGDPTYGGPKVRELEGVTIPHVMLHARKLGFLHPATGTYLEFTAPPPPDMEAGTSAFRRFNELFLESLEAFEGGRLLSAIQPLLTVLDHLDRMRREKEIAVTPAEEKRMSEYRATLNRILPGNQPELEGAGKGIS